MSRRFATIVSLVISLICALAPASAGSNASGRTLILFAKETSLLPEVEKILSELHDRTTNDLLFSRVINLNKWSINKLETAELDDLVRFYESESILRRRSTTSEKRDAELLKLVRSANTYIRIDVLQKLPLLEFQVYVTDSVPVGDSSLFPVLITDATRLEGFLVDISKPDHAEQLSDGLRRIFPQTNVPPTPIIRVMGAKCINDYWYIGVGRSLILDASASYDADGLRDSLEYRWTQLNPAGGSTAIVTERVVSLQAYKAQQVVVFPDTGEFCFGFVCCDGVTSSPEQIIRIRAVSPPRIRIESFYEASTYFLDRRWVRIPFSVEKGASDSILVKVICAEKSMHPSLLGHIFHMESSKYILDSSNNYSIVTVPRPRPDSLMELSYRLSLLTSISNNYTYRIKLVAQDTYISSDTVAFEVSHRDKTRTFDIALQRCLFTPDSATGAGGVGSFSTLALRVGLVFNISKRWAYETGIINRLTTDKGTVHEQFANSFSAFFSINWESFSLEVCGRGNRTGYGASVDFLRFFSDASLAVGFLKYPDGWTQTSVRLGAGLDSTLPAVLLWLYMMTRYIF